MGTGYSKCPCGGSSGRSKHKGTQKHDRHSAETNRQSRALLVSETIEFGRSDTHAIRLQQENNKRLHERNETLSKESEDRIEQLNGEIKLLTKATKDKDKEIKGLLTNAADLERENERLKATLKIERDTHAPLKNSSLQTQTENAFPGNSKAFKNNEMTNETVKMKSRGIQVETLVDRNSTEHLRQEKDFDFEIRCSKEVETLNSQTQKEEFVKEKKGILKEINGKTTKLSKLKEDKESRLAQMLPESTESYEVLEQEKEVLKREIEKMQEQIDDQTSNFVMQTEHFVQHIQTLENEKENLRRKTAKQTFEKEKMEKQITYLKEENEKLEANTNILLEKNHSLQTNLETQKESNETILNEVKSELDKLRERNNEIEKALTSTKQDNQKLKEEYGSIKLQLEENLEHRLQLLRTKNEDAFKSFEKEKKMIEKEHLKIQKELNAEIDTLSKSKGSLDNLLAIETKENVKVKSRITDLSNYIKQYEFGRTLQTEAVEDKEKFIENLEQGVQKLIDENRTLKENHRKITAKQTSERKSLETQITELKGENEKLVAETKLLLEKNHSLQTTLKIQKESNDAMLNEVKTERDKVNERNKETEKALTIVKERNQKLKEEYDSIQQKLEEKSAQHLQLLRTEKEDALKRFENEKKILHKEHMKKQKQLTAQIDTLSKLKDSLENRLAIEIDEKDKVKSRITHLSKCIKQYEFGRTLQIADVEDKEKLIENLEQDVQKLIDENGTLKDNHRKITAKQKYEKENFEKQITELKEESEKLEAKTKSLLENNHSLQTTLETQKESNDAMLNEIKTELEKLRERNNETEKALTSTKEDNQKLLEEYSSIKLELDKLKSTKVMRVQLYHNNRIALVSERENEIKALLKSEMEDAMTELDFIECNKACDIDLNIPLLIVCICVSRLGTDAANAIQSLKLTSKMALIIFHHKDVHALPNQASERVLTGQAFTRLGGVYDLAFLSSKGIYTCDMNLKNMKSLVYFLNKEGVRIIREDP